LKQAITALLSALLFSAQICQAEEVARVSDPYKDLHFSCSGKPDGRLWDSPYATWGYGRFRFRADLNFEGIEDLIISTQSDGIGCGQIGCDVTFYLKQPDGRYIKIQFTDEEFALHPLAVNLRRIKSGEGKLSIYERENREEGAISSYKVTADSINLINAKHIKPGSSENDERLYDSFFGDNSRLTPEFAWCKNEKVEWNNSYR
jgi:hypothetical protein